MIHPLPELPVLGLVSFAGILLVVSCALSTLRRRPTSDAPTVLERVPARKRSELTPDVAEWMRNMPARKPKAPAGGLVRGWTFAHARARAGR